MRASLVAALAGILPIIAVNAAFWININTGLEGCFPYIEGCYSVSGAIRSGPGLMLFKIMAIPAALAMALCWFRTSKWLEKNNGVHGSSGQWMKNLGIAGALFFVIYAAFLGTDGELYRWMRRYGVVFYFAGTALAQLLLASVLWNQRRSIAGGALYRQSVTYFGVVLVMWLLGVASAFKRKLIEDPEFLDRVENALEWDFGLALSLAFVALAWLHQSAQRMARSGQE